MSRKIPLFFFVIFFPEIMRQFYAVKKEKIFLSSQKKKVKLNGKEAKIDFDYSIIKFLERIKKRKKNEGKTI